MVNNGRNSKIDLLRVIAISGVLFFHGAELGLPPPWFSKVGAFGWWGVDLFFVLSGFLIARELFNENFSPSPLKTVAVFWVRRWTRIFPLYFFVLAFYLIIKPWLGYPFPDKQIPYLFLVQNYFSMRDFIQTWSLCVEEHFYLAFPLLLAMRPVRQAPAWVWLLPCAASLLFRTFAKLEWTGTLVGSPGYEFGWRTHLHLDAISVGIFLAATQERWKILSRKHWKLAVVAGVIVLLGVAVTLGPVVGPQWGGVIYYTGLAVGFGLLTFAGAEAPVSFPFIMEKCIHFFAKISYGTYLWFWLGLRVLDRTGFAKNNWGIGFSGWFVFTHLMAFFTFYLVERPGLRLRRLFIATRPSRLEAPEAALEESSSRRLFGG